MTQTWKHSWTTHAQGRRVMQTNCLPTSHKAHIECLTSARDWVSFPVD